MKYILSFAFSILLTSITFGQTRIIDSLLESYNKIGILNGVVLVTEEDRTVYQGAFGNANFEWNIPNSINTKFKIASISKDFTTVLVFQLCESGKMKLDSKVSDYLPGLKNGDKISIYQLLTHTSGLIDQRNIPGFDSIDGPQKMSRSNLLNLFKDSSLLFKPGTGFYYSNFNFNLLAMIIETIYKKDFTTILKEKIFRPAKMTSTSTTEEQAVNPELASGYEKQYTDVKMARYFDATLSVGCSGIITTCEDLFRFYRSIKNGTLINDTDAKKFDTPVAKDQDGNSTGYSSWFFNFHPTANDSTPVVYHSGNHFGVHALVYDLFEKKKMIILLLNVKTPELFDIADNILKCLYHQPPDWPKISPAVILSADIKKIGVNEAISVFQKRLDAKEDSDYPLKPRDLNRLGYYYLENNEPLIAIEIFKLNLLYFPESDFYDSLGEAYKIAGNKVDAAFNLKKSIELDPKNEHAKKLLEGLDF